MLADENGSGHNGHPSVSSERVRKNIFSNGPVLGEWATGADALAQQWAADPRWKDIERTYTAEDVTRLRGSVPIAHTLAKRGAERLWYLINRTQCAMVSEVANDIAALSGVRSGATVIHTLENTRVNTMIRALRQADQADWARNQRETYWFAPLIADVTAQDTAGIFEQAQALIEDGVAGITVFAGSREPSLFVQHVRAVRLAADVMGTPTVVIAHAQSVTQALATAPYADVVGFDHAFAQLGELNAAQRFADIVHAQLPGKPLGCDISGFEASVASTVQHDLCSMGYRLQFEGVRDVVVPMPTNSAIVEDILCVVKGC